MGTSESDGASPRPSDVAGRSVPAERPRALTGALWTIVALVAWTLVLELVIPLATGELVAAYPDGPSDAVVVAESVIGAAGGVAGLPGAIAELPVTVTMLLRGLLEIAEEHGLDPKSDEVRKELRSGLGRWRRVRSDISLRPFLDRRPRPVGQAGRRRLTLPRARKTATS